MHVAVKCGQAMLCSAWKIGVDEVVGSIRFMRMARGYVDRNAIQTAKVIRARCRIRA